MQMMPLNDLLPVLLWWLSIFAITLIFLPLTTITFSSFIDRGYIFAKILGLLILSYLVWLSGSLHLLPFTSLTIFLILGLSALGGFILIVRGTALQNVTRSQFKLFLGEELTFLGGFIFWAYIRAHEPSVHGLEKYMDFGFINSLLRTNFFPPADLWMSPLSINYYYFGHLVTAVLTKLSGIEPAVSFNLMVAALFGLMLAGSFSIGANLYQKFAVGGSRLVVLSGILSAFLVTLGGNLHTIYLFFKSYPNPENPLPFWQLPFGINFSGYWYPNATRFIPLTIHEFPLYSFVVSDLHGHVLDIPFVLLFIALLISIFFSPKLDASRCTLAALLIAVFLMTNVLDGPIYLILIFFVLLARQLQYSKLRLALWQSFKSTTLISGFAAIFSLPFWLAFTPFSSGIGVLCAPSFLTSIGRIGPFIFEANHCARSPLWQLAILWGFPFFILLGFIFYVLKFRIDFKFKISNLKLNSADLLILAFALAAVVLILIPEFFYAKDIYPAHYRANTVFKFGYQAFIILSLASGYMITRFLTSFRKTIRYTIYAIPLFILFLLVAVYPYFAIKSYYGELKNYQGLNGLSYLSSLYPSDYLAILWLQQNIQGQPVILEAQGDSYTDFARVSANTGLPTVIGWPVHEWLWRGTYDEAGLRSAEVTQLYESSDLILTKNLLQKYHVSYVFVGILERQKYLNLNEEKFTQLGKIIFQAGNTKIYQLNK